MSRDFSNGKRDKRYLSTILKQKKKKVPGYVGIVGNGKAEAVAANENNTFGLAIPRIAMDKSETTRRGWQNNGSLKTMNVE